MKELKVPRKDSCLGERESEYLVVSRAGWLVRQMGASEQTNCLHDRIPVFGGVARRDRIRKESVAVCTWFGADTVCANRAVALGRTRAVAIRSWPASESVCV